MRLPWLKPESGGTRIGRKPLSSGLRFDDLAGEAPPLVLIGCCWRCTTGMLRIGWNNDDNCKRAKQTENQMGGVAVYINQVRLAVIMSVIGEYDWQRFCGGKVWMW